MESPPEYPGSSHLPQPQPRPKREHQLRGPRPPPLRVGKDVHFLRQQLQLGQRSSKPVVTYAATSNTMTCSSGRAQRESGSKIVLQYLADPTVSIIGIYGRAGIGKTTFAADIRNQLLNHPIHSVSWVTASPNISIRNLQDDIARSLDFDLSDEDDEEKRVEKLSAALKEKNTVLILDDLSHHIRQKDLGIPMSTRGCKLIFTTRSLDVRRKMGCHKMISIVRLSHDEGWELFMEKMGPGIIFPHSIEQIAKSIVKNCSGSPFAIVSMAANMKGVEDLGEWCSALNKIKENKVPQDYIMYTDNNIYRILRYCYDKLNDPSAQQCLLYCGNYPEGFKIDREMLIENFIDAGLVDGKNREAEFNKGNAVLDKLENAFFLEGGTCRYEKRYVKVNNLVRKFLLYVSRRTLPSVFLETLPEDEIRLMEIEQDTIDNQLVENLEMPGPDITCDTNHQYLSHVLSSAFRGLVYTSTWRAMRTKHF